MPGICFRNCPCETRLDSVQIEDDNILSNIPDDIKSKNRSLVQEIPIVA